MESCQASGEMAESVAIRLPVSGSSWTSLIPVQNEPNANHSEVSAPLVTDGSMALKESPACDWMTTPWSVQAYDASAGSNVGFVTSPMAEVFLPQLDTE